MTASMTSVLDRPTAGLKEVIDDIEREDGNKPEGSSLRIHHPAKIRTGAEVRLADELLRRVRSVDAQTPVSRRAPRTLQEMRARLSHPAVAATEDDLNKELDNPADDWDQAVPRPVLPRAEASPLPATSEVNCPHCNESNEAGSACKRCGH
ncbi:hypothetical protein ACPCUV_24525 [Streptomyces platensis]|uniref:hypothetical protein n=1 Tax=Streptomyces platensis TaxID=58346 RepID=UPI003C2C9B56